jgi:hypothetical protein
VSSKSPCPPSRVPRRGGSRPPSRADRCHRRATFCYYGNNNNRVSWITLSARGTVHPVWNCTPGYSTRHSRRYPWR